MRHGSAERFHQLGYGREYRSILEPSSLSPRSCSRRLIVFSGLEALLMDRISTVHPCGKCRRSRVAVVIRQGIDFGLHAFVDNFGLRVPNLSSGRCILHSSALASFAACLSRNVRIGGGLRRGGLIASAWLLYFAAPHPATSSTVPAKHRINLQVFLL
jgi:hypothetical protein